MLSALLLTISTNSSFPLTFKTVEVK